MKSKFLLLTTLFSLTTLSGCFEEATEAATNETKSNKNELSLFADEHNFKPKEFKEALKPFRKGDKKDD